MLVAAIVVPRLGRQKPRYFSVNYNLSSVCKCKTFVCLKGGKPYLCTDMYDKNSEIHNAGSR